MGPEQKLMGPRRPLKWRRSGRIVKVASRIRPAAGAIWNGAKFRHEFPSFAESPTMVSRLHIWECQDSGKPTGGSLWKMPRHWPSRAEEE